MAEQKDSPSRSGSVAHNRGALKIVGLYALLGALWILFSDQLAEAIVGDSSTLTKISMVKGWGYVLVTALLLYGLIRRYTASLHASEERYRSLSSDLQAANQQLGQALAHEQAARTELEAMNQELEALIYTVSHDLRAPLNLIHQLSELALEQYGASLPEAGQRCLRQILAHASTTDCLAEDLLALSRATRLSPQKETVDMRLLVEQVVAESQAAHGEPRADIRIGDLPAAEADLALLKQVWAALVSNAVKFTHPRTSAHIEIGSFSADGRPVYFIKDNGVGFDMAQSNRLFRAFQRLHHAEDFPGTGVGLTIAEHIIRRHGGRVWAEAEVDRGATFYFTLGGQAKDEAWQGAL